MSRRKFTREFKEAAVRKLIQGSPARKSAVRAVWIWRYYSAGKKNWMSSAQRNLEVMGRVATTAYRTRDAELDRDVALRVSK
jgi:hypothetical protein